MIQFIMNQRLNDPCCLACVFFVELSSTTDFLTLVGAEDKSVTKDSEIRLYLSYMPEHHCALSSKKSFEPH